jgi:hypothetical protein
MEAVANVGVEKSGRSPARPSTATNLRFAAAASEIMAGFNHGPEFLATFYEANRSLSEPQATPWTGQDSPLSHIQAGVCNESVKYLALKEMESIGFGGFEDGARDRT